MPTSLSDLKNAGSAGNGFSGIPEPGSVAEVLMFKKLQERFPLQFQNIFPDKLAPRTVVIIPSLTMDPEILAKVSGVNHYEERLLCMLMLLRMPRTHVIYVTSETIDPIIVDYYLHMLPGITGYHALRRLTLLSCHDSSSKPLTQKILERPRLINRIRDFIPPDHEAHMSCFNVTALERSLAVRLQIPIYGCDPDLFELGNKSNSRKIFKECGLLVPAGFEDLKSEDDIINALAELKKGNPVLRKAVLKINDGFSGDGNAVFYYKGIEESKNQKQWIRDHLKQQLKMVSEDLSYEMFLQKFFVMGGIAEEFIEGLRKESPSVQCRITPSGEIDIISTHDQELGGESGQVYIGAHFPASKEYSIELGILGKKVAASFEKKGVLGRFAIDFISVLEKDARPDDPVGRGWKHYAIEINLRKGGTTHPFMMLQFLTDGRYNPEEGLYYTSKGHLIRYYFCSDNLKSEKYIGLSPHDLIDIAMMNDLHYDGTSQEGVMFHLIGALSQFGKLGVVCIGSTPERAREYYAKIVTVLEKEC
ncbi:MAG: carboxylate-amine ligase [Bacteroidetes bacterium]|nr:carboxylate-amine ligase [Bacteroidota bacterium]MBS1632380.1 carboxylate-amine ligase [Bacteroidota bacterium]